jgi:hypothetical protein
MAIAYIDAPSAKDALVMFDINVAKQRVNNSSQGPYVFDVANIECTEKVNII